MQLDNFYKKAVENFECHIREIFCENMIQIDKHCSFENRGYFKLSYLYLPLNYKIIIENEIRSFNIKIEDEEKAFNSLYGIEKHKATLEEEENVYDSLSLLKRVLERNDFNFYLHKNDKLYRKNAQGLKRVKDIKELYNG